MLMHMLVTSCCGVALQSNMSSNARKQTLCTVSGSARGARGARYAALGVRASLCAVRSLAICKDTHTAIPRGVRHRDEANFVRKI